MLLEGLKELIKEQLNDGSVSEEELNEIANNIINDDEFRQVLLICIKYYRGKQMRGELGNDGIRNNKRM